MGDRTFRAAIRALACLLAILAGLFGAGPVRAHDGANAPDMLARVVSAYTEGQEVTVTLELTNLGGPLVLVGVSAPGATAAAIAPVYLNFAQDAQVITRLTFGGPVSGAFTLTLNFGPSGEGRVEVTPMSR